MYNIKLSFTYKISKFEYISLVLNILFKLHLDWNIESLLCKIVAAIRFDSSYNDWFDNNIIGICFIQIL